MAISPVSDRGYWLFMLDKGLFMLMLFVYCAKRFIEKFDTHFHIYYSLNREKRMRELLRVAKENQEILQRIAARKPEYDHGTWQKQWEEKQKFMDNISKYPKNWWMSDKEKEEAKKSKVTMETGAS